MLEWEICQTLLFSLNELGEKPFNILKCFLLFLKNGFSLAFQLLLGAEVFKEVLKASFFKFSNSTLYLKFICNGKNDLMKKKYSLQLLFSSCFNSCFKEIENMFQDAEFWVLFFYFWIWRARVKLSICGVPFWRASACVLPRSTPLFCFSQATYRNLPRPLHLGAFSQDCIRYLGTLKAFIWP